jgi:hypothetical protein
MVILSKYIGCHLPFFNSRNIAMATNKFSEVEREKYPYIFMKNVDIPLVTHEKGLLRCNVYLPKDAAPFGTKKYPVIATYGPCEYPS